MNPRITQVKLLCIAHTLTSRSEGKMVDPAVGSYARVQTTVSEKSPFLSEYTFAAQAMSVSCFTLACARVRVV